MTGGCQRGREFWQSVGGRGCRGVSGNALGPQSANAVCGNQWWDGVLPESRVPDSQAYERNQESGIRDLVGERTWVWGLRPRSSAGPLHVARSTPEGRDAKSVVARLAFVARKSRSSHGSRFRRTRSGKCQSLKCLVRCRLGDTGFVRRTKGRFVARKFFRGMGVGRELNLRPCALCLLVQGLGSSLKPKGESHVTSSLQALD